MKKIIHTIYNYILKEMLLTKEFISNHIIPVLHFMEAVKEAINSPVVDGIVLVTPTKIDNVLLPIIRSNLAIAIEVLELSTICKGEMLLQDKINCYIRHLQGLSPELQKAIIGKTASIVARLIAQKEYPNTFKNSDVDTLVQVAYSQFKNYKKD